MKKRHLEFWINTYGWIIISEQNPCGCCPFSFLITWKTGQTYTYDFSSRREFKAFANRRGLEKLR